MRGGGSESRRYRNRWSFAQANWRITAQTEGEQHVEFSV
jgi:hypothetical protein